MPWGDWQFWVVTVIAILCAWRVIKPLIPRGKGSAARSRGGKKVTLTVEKKKI